MIPVNTIHLKPRSSGSRHELFQTIKKMVDDGEVARIPCLDESHADSIAETLKTYGISGRIEKHSYVDTSRGHIHLANCFIHDIPIPEPKVRWSITITPKV